MIRPRDRPDQPDAERVAARVAEQPQEDEDQRRNRRRRSLDESPRPPLRLASILTERFDGIEIPVDLDDQ
jgi:hypothetical protein